MSLSISLHKIVIYTMDLRLRASSRHGAQEIFLFDFCDTEPPRGRHSSFMIIGGNNPVSYLNHTFFLESDLSHELRKTQ
jgi:hypothetical protein